MERKPNPAGWHKEDIKAELRKRGVTMADISRALGHSQPDTVRKVFTQVWPAMEQLIADILEVHPAMIWPERYWRDGTPKGRGIRKAYPKLTVAGIGKTQGAA